MCSIVGTDAWLVDQRDYKGLHRVFLREHVSYDANFTQGTIGTTGQICGPGYRYLLSANISLRIHDDSTWNANPRRPARTR